MRSRTVSNHSNLELSERVMPDIMEKQGIFFVKFP